MLSCYSAEGAARRAVCLQLVVLVVVTVVFFDEIQYYVRTTKQSLGMHTLYSDFDRIGTGGANPGHASYFAPRPSSSQGEGVRPRSRLEGLASERPATLRRHCPRVRVGAESVAIPYHTLRTPP